MDNKDLKELELGIRIKQPPKSPKGKGSTLEPYTLPFCKGIHSKKK